MARASKVIPFQSSKQVTDILVENHGSIVLLRPISTHGADWIEQNILNVNEEAQTFGAALVVEPRYVADVVAGMRADGLKIETDPANYAVEP